MSHRRLRLHAGGPASFQREFRRRCREEIHRIAQSVAQGHGYSLEAIRAGKRGRIRSGRVVIARCYVMAALEDAGFTAEAVLHMADLFPGTLSAYKLCALVGHELPPALRSRESG